MTPQTEAFLDLVRHAEEPSEEDAQRIFRALQASVAAGITARIAVEASRPRAWLAEGAQALASTIAKLSLVAVGTVVGLSVETRPATPTSMSSALPPPKAVTRARAPAAAAALSSVASAASPRAQPSAATPLRPRKNREPVASLRSELDVLEKAQRALQAGDGESALRELDAAGKVDGPLQAERRAVRILALCSAGRDSEARAASARFLEEYPDSAHRAAIARACTNLQWIERR